MRHVFVLAVVVFAIGCSSHSATGLAPNTVFPEVFQKHFPHSGWISIPLNPVHGQEADPFGLVADPNHKIWVADSAGAVSEIAMDQHVNTFLLPIVVHPEYITVGSDRNLWVTTNVGEVVRVTPTGSYTIYNVAPSTVQLRNITLGPDGALWFDECGQSGAGGIGTITTAGVYTFYNVGCQSVIAIGSDDNIWFGNGASVFAMSTQGIVLGQFAVGDTYFYGMANGSDGALYLTGYAPVGGYQLTRVTTHGEITKIGGDAFSDFLTSIVNGPEGDLWISADDDGHNYLVTFDPTTQTFNERINAPRRGPLALGPDGNLWLSDRNQAIDIYVRMAMTLAPRPLTVSVHQSANLYVTETNYSGKWTALAKKPSIATVTKNSLNGAFVVSGVSPGSTFVTVYDTMFNSVSVKVTVQ